MAGLSLAMTIWSPWSFFALIALGVSLMGWEWRKMISSDDQGRRSAIALAVHLVTVFGAIYLAHIGRTEYGLGFLFTGSILLIGLSWKAERMLSFFGPFYTGLPALGLIWIRSDPGFGVAAVLFVFLVVWMAILVKMRITSNPPKCRRLPIR